MKSKKRIALFGLKGLPGYGGAARANENIIKELKNDYNFIVYSINTHTKHSGYRDGYFQFVFKGYRYRRLNILQYYIKSVLHALFIESYDLVMINHTSSGFIAPLLRLKYKIVARATGIIPKDDNKWNRIDKLFFKLSTMLFFYFSNECISVAKPHIQIYKNISRKKIHYIPNGIKIEVPYQENKDPNLALLFSAARIISLKGGHILLEALKIINFKKSVKFIGDLNHNAKYKHQILNLSNGLNIEFINLIKDKKILFEHLCKSSLFIFPSFNEGMSNMLLEAISLSLPVICSDIKENRSIFNENEVLFFKTGNTVDLSLKIQWAYDNYNLMVNKSEQAYNKLKENYKLEIIAEKYSKIYSRLVQTNDT